MTGGTLSVDATRRLRARIGLPPRHRLFRECADGWLIGWTVETDTDFMEGRWASLVWKPVGPGARTGQARRWEPVPALFGVHRTRRQAKARAVRLWRQHEAAGLARVTSTSDE